MKNTRFKAIECKISRGGFSDERVFRIEFSDRAYEGIASRRHMWTETGQPIEDGEPPIGQLLDGLVAARVLELNADQSTAIVSIPDGGVIEIAVGQLKERPEMAGSNVPIGS